MLTIKSKGLGSQGEVWYTETDDDKHDWLFETLPYLVLHDDLHVGPVPSMQQDSDLKWSRFFRQQIGLDLGGLFLQC